MTQLLPASERSSSDCMRGSATITMVPSSVDISCMPVIAMIAMPSTCDDNDGMVRSVEPEEPPAADMGRKPTQSESGKGGAVVGGLVATGERRSCGRGGSVEIVSSPSVVALDLVNEVPVGQGRVPTPRGT